MEERSLLLCCELDDVDGAVHHLGSLLSELRRMSSTQLESTDMEYEKKDAILLKLFVDESDDDTPVEAALRMGGAGANSNTRMKLFILECLLAAGPIVRFENDVQHPAYVPRLGKTLQHQVLSFLVRLGALMRPYATADQSRRAYYGSAELIDQEMMSRCLEAYASVPHDAIALCIANGFHAEYPEIRRVMSEFGGAELSSQLVARNIISRRFPNDVERGNLGTAFLTALLLARDANLVADSMRSSLRLYDAEKHRDLSRRLQLAVAAALDDLGDDVTYLLIRHYRGRDAMRLASLEGMYSLLSQGAMRGAVRRVWLGENLFNLLADPSMVDIMRHLFLIAYNLALLPLIAATPFIDAHRSSERGWVNAFMNRDNYLLQV